MVSRSGNRKHTYILFWPNNKTSLQQISVLISERPTDMYVPSSML